MINAANPLGANQILVTGHDRRSEPHGYSRISRSDKTLPNQRLRLRRVGDYFSAYVGTDGLMVPGGQRYQQMARHASCCPFFRPVTSSRTEWVPAARIWRRVKFSNYGNVVLNDTQAPTLASAGTADKKIVGGSSRGGGFRHGNGPGELQPRPGHGIVGGPALAVTRVPDG